ncbi:uncharacterized protein LOC142235830 [Haematobia irritans]|uniref:uncharacterized protein LOC142235830 n=1 Tax=Haematobia irritans TaxID=7368 RepID=UPI003F4F6051
MFKIVITIAFILGIFHQTEAICGKCNANNGVACVSDKEFHVCFGGIPDTTKTYKCHGENEVCTKYSSICMDTSVVAGLKQACGDTSNCGKCENVPSGKFTCTSRTTYTMCLDNQLTEIRLACPDYQICDVEKAATGTDPCVAECRADSIGICDLAQAIDVPATSTTIAPSTTTTTAEVPDTTTVGTTTEVPEAESSTTTTTTPPPPPPSTTTTIPTFAPTPTTTEIPITTSTESSTSSTSTTTTEAPTTTTETVTTPPPPTQNPAAVLCSQQTVVGRYPYPGDTTCTRYINCFWRGEEMLSSTMVCPTNKYFNASTRICEDVKPQGCI